MPTSLTGRRLSDHAVAASGLLVAGALGALCGSGNGVLVLAAILAAGVVTACFLSDGVLVFALTIASMVTRPALAVGPASLRFEIVFSLVAGLALFLGLRRDEVARSETVSLAWAGWWVYLAVVTVLVAKDVTASLSTLLWLGASMVAAYWVVRHPGVVPFGISVGLWASMVLAAAATLLWLVNLVAPSMTLGLQLDTAYGGYAAYVLSIEANVLAGLLVLWTILAHIMAPSARWHRWRWRHSALAATATVAAHTRTALIALAVALVIVYVRSVLRAVAAILALLVIVFPFALAADSIPGLDKFWGGARLNEGTGEVRVNSWTVAVSQVHSDAFTLLFGHGFNSFGQHNLDPTQPETPIAGYLGNLPLQLLYDGGLLSLVLALWLSWLLIRRLQRLGRTREALALCSAYFLISLSTSILWLLEAWLVAAFAWVWLTHRPSADERVLPLPSMSPLP